MLRERTRAVQANDIRLGEDFKADEYFETKATVVYAHSALGMGLAFRDVKPDCRMVMQKRLIAALQDNLPKP